MKLNSYLANIIAQNTFSVLSLLAIFAFAYWWFSPSHIPQNFGRGSTWIDIVLFAVVSYVIWQPIVMEVLTWVISSHIKDLKQHKPQPGAKVAFITTIVPKNEDLQILHKCLPAMVNAHYKHDTWLLDEENNPEVKAICQKYGVYHFSRAGIERYNSSIGKFLKKTKGGNHNSWYDSYGNYYDFVAQIDSDFIPKKNFLIKTLGYFNDPKVAFVGTPQIYGNTENSLVAQGANEQQLSFYGAVLRGLSGMGMTLLIGANHVIRVDAFRRVGHYTAHITEDLVTGMKLHANGYKSVYIPHALAIGEGPSTWEAYFNQQLRWAYGCIDILLNHSPKFFLKLGFRKSLVYFFLQQHYFSGIVLALSLLLLSVYFIFGLRSASIDVFYFCVSYSLILLICWMMSLWLQRYNIKHKQHNEFLLAGRIISIAAWPVWFLALVNILSRQKLVYHVTPKGDIARIQSRTSYKTFQAHLIFALIPLIGIVSSFYTGQQSLFMVFWALSSVVLMLLLPHVETVIRVIENSAKIISKILLLPFTLDLKPVKTAAAAVYFQKYDVLKDSLFLILMGILSVMFYIKRLGFYSDDWSFLGNFIASGSRSFFPLLQVASTPNTFMRPVQNVLDVSLYLLFGLNPAGYHFFNAAILISIALMFYAVLRLFKIPRIITLSAPLVFLFLPNYSTDRFWFASFQANISILFYLLSLYFGVKGIAIKASWPVLFKSLSIMFLLLSTLAYEVVLPLYLFNLIIFINPNQALYKNRVHHLKRKNPSVFIFITVIALIYLLVFKSRTSVRLGDGPLHNLFSNPDLLFNLLIGPLQTNYGIWLLQSPFILQKFVSSAGREILLIGAGVFTGVYFYLFTILADTKYNFPTFSFLKNLTLLSFIIFFLGYAVFFSIGGVGVSPTGIDNRIAIAASIGVAFSFIGLVGLASKLITSEFYQRIFFSAGIAAVCAMGIIFINTISTYWINASKQNQAIIATITSSIPVLSKNSVILLDGQCRYNGPAPIFEANWDLKGALQSYYKDGSIQADVIKSNTLILEDGIQTQIYNQKIRYPYGENLFVFNQKTKQIHQLKDLESAREYFNRYNPDLSKDCRGEEGYGESII